MLEFLRENGKILTLVKGKHLFKQGECDGSFYFVESGLLKVYYISRAGKEFVKSFIDAGGYVASIGAMLGVDSCPFGIVALEDADLIRIPSGTILNAGKDDPERLSSINQALLRLVLKKEKREYEFLCLNAEERYVRFRREYPGLESRISQYDIAKYLGITPVALSRIRKRLEFL